MVTHVECMKAPMAEPATAEPTPDERATTLLTRRRAEKEAFEEAERLRLLNEAAEKDRLAKEQEAKEKAAAEKETQQAMENDRIARDQFDEQQRQQETERRIEAERLRSISQTNDFNQVVDFH